jgi:hypothetical protein
MGTTDVIGSLLAGIEGAAIPESIFCSDVVLDATVPNWRFQLTGVHLVREELGSWFADVGRFEEVRRTDINGGELVEFVRSWDEEGVRHQCHQVHVVRLRDSQIASDIAFCGGRWPESLLIRMEEEQRARDRTAAGGAR